MDISVVNREGVCGKRCKFEQEGFKDELSLGLIESEMSDDTPHPGETVFQHV